MKTKLKLLLPMIALTLAAFSTAPKNALASCSGDDCGCGETMQACVAACPAPPDPNHQSCVASCRHDDIVCSLICCIP